MRHGDRHPSRVRAGVVLLASVTGIGVVTGLVLGLVLIAGVVALRAATGAP